MKVVEGQKIKKPEDPTKENYIFSGWYKDAEHTAAWDFDKDVVNGDITLYARWSEIAETVYTVTFDMDGGNEIEPVSVKADETVTEPANPVKIGYKFGGWYSDTEKQSEYDFNTPVTDNITIYAKWEKMEFALVDFDDTGLEAQEVTWDAGTKTLDITKATGSVTLAFNVTGASEVTNNPTHKYDTYALSIGGTEQLKEIAKVVGTVDSKIKMEVKIPNQSPKVPLDIEVIIADAGDPNAKDVITIKSRPDYAGTGIQPVLMKTMDNKLVFWAPVNVGATEIPTIVPRVNPEPGGTNVITKSCGLLFQWGRKYGFENTNNTTDTDAEAFDGKTDPLGFPTGKGALKEMHKWDGKFILRSESSPNTQYNWLLFNEGSDNPDMDGMIDDEWYHKLWNEGTEDSPVKTDYDPCPDGWRVPTDAEWEAIGVDNRSVPKDWDDTNHLWTIAGAESDQKLILPAAGRRFNDSGTTYLQGYGCFYWSSVPSTNVHAQYVGSEGHDWNGRLKGSRAMGHSVRCIQE